MYGPFAGKQKEPKRKSCRFARRFVLLCWICLNIRSGAQPPFMSPTQNVPSEAGRKQVLILLDSSILSCFAA